MNTIASVMASTRRRPMLFVLVTISIFSLLSHPVEILGFVNCSPLAVLSGLGLGTPTNVLRGKCFVDDNAGMTTQALGHLVAESWLHFRLPWWNPYAGVGLPLAAAMQPAAFFLPFVLLLHFTSGLLLLKISMQCVAGASMFLCLRSMGLRRGAALCGGVLFELNGTFAWYGDAPSLPVPFLPLLVYGLENSRTLAAARKPGGSLAIAGGIGFSLLAGFPETAFIDGLLALAWCLLLFCKLDVASRRRFAGKVLVGGLCGLCISAPALLPFLDFLAHATFSTFREFFVVIDQLQAGQQTTLLIPTIFGPPYFDYAIAAWSSTGGYLATGAVLLGIYALLTLHRRRVLRLGLLIWIAAWTAVFLHASVVWEAFRATPLLNQIMVTRYAMPSIEFASVVLAASGLDDLFARKTRYASMIAPLLFFLLVAISVASIPPDRHTFSSNLAMSPFGWPSLVWALALSIALGFLMSRRASALSPAICCCLLVIDSLLSFTLPTLAGTHSQRIDKSLLAFLHAHAGLSRVYSWGSVLAPNYGSYFEVANLYADYEPMPTDWAAYSQRLDPGVVLLVKLTLQSWKPDKVFLQHRSGFEAVGTRFVLVDPKDDPFEKSPVPDLPLVFQSATAHVYELPNAKPYFSVAGGPCRLTFHDRQNVKADCAAPATLERLEMADPGWKARANGHKLPITRVGDIFQQVHLPAGKSPVAFTYVPPRARLIAIVFGLGVLGMLVMGRRSHRTVSANAIQERPHS